MSEPGLKEVWEGVDDVLGPRLSFWVTRDGLRELDAELRSLNDLIPPHERGLSVAGSWLGRLLSVIGGGGLLAATVRLAVELVARYWNVYPGHRNLIAFVTVVTGLLLTPVAAQVGRQLRRGVTALALQRTRRTLQAYNLSHSGLPVPATARFLLEGSRRP